MMRRALINGLLVAGLAMALSACGGLGGEPVIVATIPPVTPAPTDVGFPVTPPDMGMGAALFAEHCASCHGPNGAGDGDLVRTGQLPQAPASFLDPATARDQRPTEWFATITNGNLEKLMPPWRDALTEQERWAVAFYTYTLHYTQDQIALGQSVYQDECAECHGPNGRGDGEHAAELSIDVPSLLDRQELAFRSDTSMYNIITEGSGDPEDGMPAFENTLTERQRRAAVAYVRSLSLGQPGLIGASQQAQPEATPEATAAPDAAFIRGQVVNGTAGFDVPADLALTLFEFPAEGDPLQVAGTLGPDDTFAFPDVALDPTAQYAVTAVYRDRLFATEFYTGDVAAAAPLFLTIYELTEDPSVIAVEALVTQINAAQDGLEIAQVFQVSNSSDRAYTTSQLTPDGRAVSLLIALPPGAIVPGFNEQGRYVYAADTATVIDTAPVLPGDQHLVQLVYILPYEGSAIVEQPMNYPVSGTVQTLVRPTSLQFDGGPTFPALGEQVIGSSTYAAYGGEMTLDAGDVLRYEISGAGGASTVGVTAPGAVTSDALPLVILLVVIGEIVLVAALILWYSRRRRRTEQNRAAPPDRTALIDAMVRQIAELDADHDAGRIDDADYQQQREALKARLAELLRSDAAD